MKTLVITLAVAFGAILSAAPVHAAPASQVSGFAAKKFGEFKAGDTFTMKVKAVNVISTTGKIPKEIPNFKKGAKVKFKIGKKGELTGPGFSITFLRATGALHDYHKGKDPYKLISTGRVSKAAGKAPSGASLSFHLVVVKGFPSAYQVDYTF